MSVRLLVVGDVHFTGHQPVGRKDDFRATLKAKVQECWEVARAHDVQAILQTGDLTHSPHLTLPTLAELHNLLLQAPAPVYLVPGNHDALSQDTLRATPLGFLLAVDLVHDVATEPVILDTDPPVYLTGRGFDAEADASPGWYAAPAPEHLCDVAPGVVRVHVAHGMLVDRRLPEGVPHTRLDDLAGVDGLPDALITGHDHIGYGVRRVGRTLCVNPGALVRLTAAVEEIDRPIHVALLTIHGSGDIDAQLIPLRSAKPGAEVLSREHLEREAAREQRRAEFLELLAAETVEQALDLQTAVASIAEREKLPARVRDEALRRLARAEAGVSTP